MATSAWLKECTSQCPLPGGLYSRATLFDMAERINILTHLMSFIAELLFTFSEATYTVNEANSVIDNLVFVEKQDGRASEQILPVEVSLQLISARGMYPLSPGKGGGVREGRGRAFGLPVSLEVITNQVKSTTRIS